MEIIDLVLWFIVLLLGSVLVVLVAEAIKEEIEFRAMEKELLLLKDEVDLFADEAENLEAEMKELAEGVFHG